MSAKLVRMQGFLRIMPVVVRLRVVQGYPDLGLLSVSEMCARMTEIVDATDLPVIADADTGFGNALNTYRTVNNMPHRCCGIAFRRSGFSQTLWAFNYNKKLIQTQICKVKFARQNQRNGKRYCHYRAHRCDCC